jgi:hypothetical protein
VFHADESPEISRTLIPIDSYVSKLLMRECLEGVDIRNARRHRVQLIICRAVISLTVTAGSERGLVGTRTSHIPRIELK